MGASESPNHVIARSGVLVNRCERFCSIRSRWKGRPPAGLIGVSPVEQYECFKALFEALTWLFPLKFEPRESTNGSGLDGWVFLDGTRTAAAAAARSGVACYAVLNRPGTRGRAARRRIRFGDSTALPAVLRGQNLLEWEGIGTAPLEREAGEQIFASDENGPVWLYREEGGREVHLVSAPPPVVEPGGFLIDWFNGHRFMPLLPLLHFLRRMARGKEWETPPLRACFVFDDPSLRWPSYGCLHYADLARHAAEHNYHASIATIPLDSWWVDSRVAELFRTHAAQLSLLVHGNEHTWWELAQTREAEECLAVLAEAWRRVGRLEERHGLKVCRVMEAPYGRMNCRVVDGLIALGYDGALVTPRQFLQCNRPHPCPPAWGLEPTPCLPGGLAGIPRIVMSLRWQTEIALAAFLGQPLVVAGHHYDARNHFARMAEFANTVNGLGRVRWCDPSEIALTQYGTQGRGEELAVQLSGFRARIQIPAGVKALRVERPWLNDEDEEPLALAVPGKTGAKIFTGRAGPLPVEGPQTVEVVSGVPRVRPEHAPAPRRRLWPYVRRALMEARDRSYPYLPAAVRNGSDSHK